MFSRRRISAALIGLVLLVVGGWFAKDAITEDSAAGGAVPGAQSGMSVESLSSLPEEADQTWKLIQSKGPFPHPGKDGSVFGNREKLLPQKANGYYREYTVPTPKSKDRGARRLITGSESELYYTEDHYDSFVVVDPKR